MVLITGLLLAGALVGTLVRAHRTWQLPPGWHPLLVLSGWSLVVLVCGILGSLQAGVALVLAAGLLAGGYELVRHRGRTLTAVREPAYLALAVTGVLLALLLQGRVFTHYDNFSHWALAVKVMLTTGALPAPETPVVTFTTYPLGGASLAYLFQRTLGGAESAAMLGHDLWVASTALPLVSATGRRRLPGLALYAVAALALLTMITTPTSLLVDSLVAGLAACLILLVVVHRDQVRAAPWSFAVLAAALLMVKASGALFVAIASVVLLVSLGRREWRRVRVLLTLVAVTVPWLVWWTWSSHVSHVFPDAGSAKHSVSVDRFDQVLGEKTAEDVRSILTSFAGSVLGDGRTLLVLVALVVAGALAAHSGAVDVPVNRRLVVVVLVTVLAWEISLALMYLFSMPLREALALAGFARYQGTVRLVVLLAGLSLVAAWSAHGERRRPSSLVVLAVALAVPLTLAGPGLRSLDAQGDRERMREEITAALRSVDPRVGPQDEVCLFQAEPDSGYRAWMVRYLTLNGTVRPRTLPVGADRIPGDCDTVLLLDERPFVAELVRSAGFDLPADASVPVAVRR